MRTHLTALFSCYQTHFRTLLVSSKTFTILYNKYLFEVINYDFTAINCFPQHFQVLQGDEINEQYKAANQDHLHKDIYFYAGL